MPQDQLDALIARLASDPTFAASLAAATTVEDAQQIASEHGFDVTSAELTAATSSDTLSDADLEAVAGSGLFDTKKNCFHSNAVAC
jgi:predicted ribosomally synthesized peptide with nif11-like leader